MADSVDLTFLGEQVRRIQEDMRQIRVQQARLEGDQAKMRSDLVILAAGLEDVGQRVAALDRHVDAGFAAVNARLDQAHETMASNFAVLLAAVQRSEE